jgi:hypothetical protein
MLLAAIATGFSGWLTDLNQKIERGLAACLKSQKVFSV